MEITFKDGDQTIRMFVKDDFQLRYPDWNKHPSIYHFVKECEPGKYFHNENGPALIVEENGISHGEYWINGKLIGSKEDFDKYLKEKENEKK